MHGRCRLVNGIADSQQRGRVAASVAALSSAAGLPPLLVDIRHDATHGELPSLAQLRAGGRLAGEWLRACYWCAFRGAGAGSTCTSCLHAPARL